MRILFFDTETTGLPKDWKAPVEQLDNWPRLVQIAWQVFNQEGDLLEEHEYIIKPIGFIIPSEASAVHKITTEKALESGVDLLTILNVFSSSINLLCCDSIKEYIGYKNNTIGIAEIQNNCERYSGLIIKFYRPVQWRMDKRTTIKILRSGKINIDGGNSVEESYELYYWLESMFSEHFTSILYNPVALYESDEYNVGSGESIYDSD